MQDFNGIFSKYSLNIVVLCGILSQHNKLPANVNWVQGKRALRYFKGTKDYELKLGQRDGEKGLTTFADAGWAECDIKSNSGYLFKLFGASISWACRKQLHKCVFYCQSQSYEYAVSLYIF